MQACLQGLGCWESVQLGFTEPNANTIAGMTAAQRKHFDELKKKQGRVKSCILNSLYDSIFPKIIVAKTAKSIWDILKVSYQGNVKVKMVKLKTLITQFETLKMTESETIYQFMNKFMSVVKHRQMNGE